MKVRLSRDVEVGFYERGVVGVGTVRTQFGVHREVVAEVWVDASPSKQPMRRTRCGRVLPARLTREDEVVNCIGCVIGMDIRA